jgi:hypothetical protein
VTFDNHCYDLLLLWHLEMSAFSEAWNTLQKNLANLFLKNLCLYSITYIFRKIRKFLKFSDWMVSEKVLENKLVKFFCNESQAEVSKDDFCD